MGRIGRSWSTESWFGFSRGNRRSMISMDDTLGSDRDAMRRDVARTHAVEIGIRGSKTHDGCEMTEGDQRDPDLRCAPERDDRQMLAAAVIADRELDLRSGSPSNK